MGPSGEGAREFSPDFSACFSLTVYVPGASVIPPNPLRAADKRISQARGPYDVR